MKCITIIVSSIFCVASSFSQTIKPDTLYPSKKMQEAHCYMQSIFDNANNLIYIVDTAKQFPWAYWMKYFVDRKFPADKKNLTIVPIVNSVAYDSLKLGTTCQVYKAVNFKIFSTDDSAFVMEAEDMRITAFWEAENEKGDWQPVEYFSHSGCGNSYERFLIPQKHYLVMAANYLQGDFKTKLRLKLRVGKNVYYSTPLAGSISKSQFILPENFYGFEPLTEGYKAKRYGLAFLGEAVD